MNATRKHSRLILTFGFFENQVLKRIFHSIIQNYQVKPDELDSRVAEAWYSTRGCRTAKMSAEETREWLENLHAYKSGTLALLEDWLRQLARHKAKAGRYQLKLKLTDAPSLLTVLNDHRLFAAATHNIGQDEMDMHSLIELQELAPDQQAALYEIHFLAWLMEEILRLSAPEAAAWMEE